MEVTASLYNSVAEPAEATEKKVKRLPNLHGAQYDRSFLALLGMTKEALTFLFERR
jgi:hypothetical protein